MKTRKTGGLPAKLEAVRRRFDRWRKAHRPRSRIPDTLWDVAVRTAGTDGIHPTTRALRLDYYSLKERLEQHAAAEAESAERSTAGAFLELAGPSSVGPCECTVEWGGQGRGEDAAFSPRRRVARSGGAEPELLEPHVMIQLTPQMRILVAVEPVDFRNYAVTAVMRSRAAADAGGGDRA
jgi:hypothetical protein